MKPPAARQPNVAGITNQEWQDLFGPPPLIPGEEQTAYEALSRRVTAEVRPRDVLEEMLVREVVDLVWDRRSLRRLMAEILGAAMEQPIPSELLGNLDDETLSKLELAILKTRQLSCGRARETGIAETLAGKLDLLERIDRLLARADARRNNTLRELDRHRAALGTIFAYGSRRS